MKKKELMWSLLLHLGMNMWSDREEDGYGKELDFDMSTWETVTEYAAETGVNAIFIDIGDAVLYKSHPEISVKNAWSHEQMRAEIRRLSEMGIALYPKLNFSATHDAWLGEYSRMVSTKLYYEVCKDLINEVIDIFDTPKYFHLGMDEEWMPSPRCDFDCARYGKLFWHDINYLIDCVTQGGSTAMIFADPYWKFPEECLKEISKNVAMNPWYYDNLYGEVICPGFSTQEMRDSLTELSAHGYNTLLCGSNWLQAPHMEQMVRYASENIEEDAEHFMGFMMAPWVRTKEEKKYTLMEGIQLLKIARDKYYKDR